MQMKIQFILFTNVSLFLTGCKIGDSETEFIASGLHYNTSLIWLDLSKNNISSEGGKNLGRSIGTYCTAYMSIIVYCYHLLVNQHHWYVYKTSSDSPRIFKEKSTGATLVFKHIIGSLALNYKKL